MSVVSSAYTLLIRAMESCDKSVAATLVQLNAEKENCRLRLTNLKKFVKVLVTNALKRKDVFPNADPQLIEQLKKLSNEVDNMTDFITLSKLIINLFHFLVYCR